MNQKPAHAGSSLPSPKGQPTSPEVAVLGAAAVDWVARVMEMPPLDGIAFADHYTPFPGGSGGNVAEGLARLGCRVRFLGTLGDDEGGALLRDAFEKAGVDTSCIRTAKGQRSAACFIAVDHMGRRFIFALGGTALFDQVTDIQASQLAGVRILFIADAFPEIAGAAITFLPQGSRVVFNPGGLMVSQGLKALLPLLERTDILVLSQGESRQLTGSSDPEKACWILVDQGSKNVMLTLGKEGVLVFGDQRYAWIPAVKVDQVIDTTGAGDAFSAGVVSGLLEGLSEVDAARLGCLVAAQKISHFGARSGLPDRKQLKFYMEKIKSGEVIL
jgi:sugar/nucleoside kinase (ribokinase family)